MNRTVYEATGATDDGATIVLDTPLPIRGRVKVQVEPSAPPDLWEFLEEMHARQRARGHTPPTPEEVEEYLRELRSGWRDEENLSR
jgi:hypothetical protein